MPSALTNGMNKWMVSNMTISIMTPLGRLARSTLDAAMYLRSTVTLKFIPLVVLS